MIDVKNMTLKYPSGKGVFDISFSLRQGQTVGYLGPNGAGKTTTIRALLGFMKPESGSCSINNLDCFDDAPAIQKSTGYIPGEITFPDNVDGDEFLDLMQAMRDLSDNRRKNELLELFELNPKGKIRKYSKGMKQKLGIVTAFMHDPDILILDEPTSGLDPLMQNRFVNLILSEKKRGKTILMSSHSFEEVERTCDQVLIIKDGYIVEYSDVYTLKKSQTRRYLIKTSDDCDQAIQKLKHAGLSATLQHNQEALDQTIELLVRGDQVDLFIKTLSELAITDFNAVNQSLEDVFMQYYGDANHD